MSKEGSCHDKTMGVSSGIISRFVLLMLFVLMLPAAACDKKPGEEFIVESAKSRDAYEVDSYQGTQTNPDVKSDSISHLLKEPQREPIENPQLPDNLDDSGKESRKKTEQNHNREKRIKQIFKEVLNDFKKKGTVTPDTVYLKSGKEIHCTILEESDLYLKVRHRGLTATLENERIEKIESKTSESVEAELREIALAQATRIVDKGLVRHGREWLTLEEKKQRMKTAAQDSSGKSSLTPEDGVQNNIFPNRDVPYEIPLDDSPREQAEYLLEILRANNYSNLERELRKYVPACVKIIRRDEGDIEPLDDIVTLAVTAANPEVREAFDLMVKGGVRGKGSPSNTELQVLFWLAAHSDFSKDDTLVQAIAMANGFWAAIGEEKVRKAVYKDVHDLLIFLRKTNEAQESAGCYQLEDYPLEALVCLAWTGNYSAMSGRTQHLPSYKNRKLPLWAYKWLTVSDYRKMKEEAIKRGWISCDVNKVISSLEGFFYFCDDGETQNCSNWLYKGGNEKTTINGRKAVNHDTSNADYLFNFFLDNGYVVGDCGDETTLVNAFAISCGIATNAFSYKLSFEGKTYRHFYNIYFDPKRRSWRAYEGHVGPGGYSPIFHNRPNYPITIYINRPPIFQADYLKDTAYTKEEYRGKTVYWNDGLTISTLRDLLTEGVPSETMKKWLFGE